MALLSVNEATTFRWSFEEDIANYLEAGIPSIGVWRQKVSDCGEEKALDLLQEGGLRVSHLFWAGGFTGSDGRTFHASIEDAVEALRTAANLGAPTLTVYSGARAGHTHNHAKRLFKDALLELIPLAEQLDVTLAVEPMHPGCAGEFTFLTSLDEAIALLDLIASDRLKLVLDTYHLGADPNLVRRIPEIVSRVALVQLGDTRDAPKGEQSRCRLGEGVVPLRAITHALIEAGYGGCFDVELLGEEFESVDYGDLLRHAKEAFNQFVG